MGNTEEVRNDAFGERKVLDTKAFKTRTIFKEMDNRKNDHIWVIGLDIGYSSVKVVSGNAVASFPSFAIKQEMNDERINISSSDNNLIEYAEMDDSGKIVSRWVVGEVAQMSIEANNNSADVTSLFDRNRYDAPMFQVLARVGMAAGMINNAFGSPDGKEIYLQTGLPPKYIKSDSKKLKAVFTGRHHFQVKFGAKEVLKFDFTIRQDMFDIIDQPLGTMINIFSDKNMKFTQESKNLITKRILVMDPGFGTLDIYPYKSQVISRDECATFNEYGMMRVLQNTALEIFNRYNVEITVPAMQRCLQEGIIRREEGGTYKATRFDDILDKHNKEICNEALQKIISRYNPAFNYDYFVITGGTGAAWKDLIRNHPHFHDCNTVSILFGDHGDTSLPMIFSNARGYYVYRLIKLPKEELRAKSA